VLFVCGGAFGGVAAFGVAPPVFLFAFIFFHMKKGLHLF